MRRATRAAGLGLGVLALAALTGCGAASGRVATRDAGAPPPEERVELVPAPATVVDDGTTTTTSTSTTTTTTSPRVDAIPPTEWHVSGQLQALADFRFGDPRCAQLTHQLSGAVTLDDGTVLQLTEQFCGVIEPGSFWRGEGTFVLTGSDGSTLSGPFTSEAQLPTDGEPYRLEVRSGTGTYAGATGACTIDNHVVQPEFGLQDQSGPVVCDGTRSPQ